MAGGFGNDPWGGAFGGASGIAGLENIPTSPLWTRFDLRGVRQVDDMDRVRDFIEVSSFGTAAQFFTGSLNLASGGVFPDTPVLLDIDVPVTETFTVEYRVAVNQLPEDFDDPVGRHVLLSVMNTGGASLTLMFSNAGVAYTGAVHFDAGADNSVVFDQLLDAGGITLKDKHLFIVPGSGEWFAEGQEVVIRALVDWNNGLAYLFLTDASDVVETSINVDSTGHVLRALLPVLKSEDALVSPPDRAVVSVRGTAADEASLELFHYNLTSRLLIPDLPPRAITGSDQAVRLCSVVQLDGSASFDPEGSELTYEWRLVEAPDNSQFVGVGNDGYTLPEATPTGFTDQFFSQELGTLHGLEPVVAGDVLLVGGVSYTIDDVKPEEIPGDFYVLVSLPQIPDDLVSAGFKILRQVGISGATTAKPTFYPDVPGFYLFDLRVFDGVQWSTPTGLQRTTTVINVLESPLPRGCTPNVNFLFDYLSDFWKLVEDTDKIGVFWGALAQTVATELYTLWQYEYSKSIRDIQRTFIRRWLHYDLALGEPLPEITKTFPVWSGVLSSPFTELRINNQRLGLSSPVLASDGNITFSGFDPVLPREFAAGLERELQSLHPSFTVQVITLPTSEQQLFINAGVPFTITDSTTTLFTPGDSNGVLSGSGEKVAERTVKVYRSLEGLNLVEAFLILGEDTYTIDRVINVMGDAFPSQRVVVRRDIDIPVGTLSWRIAGWVESQLLDFYAGMVTDGDIADFEVLEQSSASAEAQKLNLVVSTTALGASPLFPSRLPVDFGPIGQYEATEGLTVRLARVVRKGRIPVDDLVEDIPVLQEKVVIENDEATLRRNLDFFVEEYRGGKSIRFVSGQGGGPDVFEGLRPPDRLWAEYTYLDNNPLIDANFGQLVGLPRESLNGLSANVDYLSAVSGLMYLYTNGPTVRNLRVGTQILLGLPFAEEDGTIEEIRRDLLGDNARILIRDSQNSEIVRSYTYPKVLELEVNAATGERYVVGDTVVRFAPLVEGAELLDYVKDPRWFEGIVNQGAFLEVQKFHTFAVRVDGRAFSLSSLLFVRDFILKLKPNYTFPKFIVQLLASDADGDEISVNDDVLMSGELVLHDGVCSSDLGSSYIFDQGWAGGGQTWAGDSGNNHSLPYRNRFDNDNNPVPAAVYPTAENVLWGFDKGTLLCPGDELTAFTCDTFGSDFTPQFDSVFKFDEGVVESFEGTDTGPIAIPSGATGLVLTLDDNVVSNDGNLVRLNLALLGTTQGTETDFEAVINVNGAPDEFVLPFSVGTVNTELLLTFSIPVLVTDVVEVRIRTASQVADSPGWTQILTKLSNNFMWTFDDTLSAGTYCNVKDLVD